MTISQALTAERERQGLSLYKLAQDSGMSAGRVKSILDGDTPNPGILTVIALLAAMGRSLSWLEKQLRKTPGV
jgi:transcriptional regulator with XRE-family HTH domain